MSREPRSILVERYAPSRRALWDAFVTAGKNSTFMFLRDYMDYHADRFHDHSLLIFRDDELQAVLPANIDAGGRVVSHQGLTFGGFVMPPAMTMFSILAVVRATLAYLSAQGVETLVYKRIPRFYSTLPDDEIDYALFLLDADLVRRDTALVVLPERRLVLRKGKKSELAKARRAGVRVVQEAGFAAFWEQVLAPRLATRYDVRPVHSVEEITLLAARLPEHIKQYSAYLGEHIVAGVTIFETMAVAHAQYSAANDAGREVGALDFLLDWLIGTRYSDKKYVDLGICNEDEGRTLNAALLRSKEGLGARSMAHDFYEIRTAHHGKLDAVLRAAETGTDQPPADTGPGVLESAPAPD